VQTTPGSALRIYQQAPCHALSAIVRRFLVIEFPTFYRDVHLPDSSAVAAFSFRGVCQINGDQLAPPMAFTGPRDILRTHQHSDSHAVLLVTFTPVGAHTFLRSPLDEIAGSTVSLTELTGNRSDQSLLSEQLVIAQNHRRRVALVESFLLSRVHLAKPDPLIGAAVAWLEQGTAGRRRIDDLARFIGLSQSALERRFRRVVGLSPKKYSSLARLRHAVRLQATGADLTTVAHSAGYFDQSHFIKEFRRATGSAPTTFFCQNSAE
jgi:AraC-like DNA-binding protein